MEVSFASLFLGASMLLALRSLDASPLLRVPVFLAPRFLWARTLFWVQVSLALSVLGSSMVLRTQVCLALRSLGAGPFGGRKFVRLQVFLRKPAANPASSLGFTFSLKRGRFVGPQY